MSTIYCMSHRTTPKGYGPAQWRRTFQNSPRILRRHRQHARSEVNVALTPICVTVGPACYPTPCRRRMEGTPWFLGRCRASSCGNTERLRRLTGSTVLMAEPLIVGHDRRAGHPARGSSTAKRPMELRSGASVLPKSRVPVLPRHRRRHRRPAIFDVASAYSCVSVNHGRLGSQGCTVRRISSEPEE